MRTLGVPRWAVISTAAMLMVVGGIAAAVLLLAGQAINPFEGLTNTEPVQTFEVATGSTPGGQPWTLVAYNSDRGLCIEVRGVAPGNLGGGGCLFDVPESHSVSLNSEGFGDPTVTVFYGPVANTVDEVSLALGAGRTLDLPTVASPPSLNFDGRFYAGVVPGDAVVESITGTSARGAIVEERAE